MEAERPADSTSLERVRRVEKTYTRRVLAWYDVFVLGIVCRLVWRCSRAHMLALYNRNVGKSHLDLGPGTGFFLDRCQFPVGDPSIFVVELNESALEMVERRIARHHPVAVSADVLEPLQLGDRKFDSVGLNMLLHCLPADMSQKGRIFDHVLPYLEPGGRVFGSTVVAEGVPHTRVARKLLDSFNDDETFHNRDDSLDKLRSEIAQRFSRFQLWTQGSVAFFEAAV